MPTRKYCEVALPPVWCTLHTNRMWTPWAAKTQLAFYCNDRWMHYKIFVGLVLVISMKSYTAANEFWWMSTDDRCKNHKLKSRLHWEGLHFTWSKTSINKCKTWGNAAFPKPSLMTLKMGSVPSDLNIQENAHYLHWSVVSMRVCYIIMGTLVIYIMLKLLKHYVHHDHAHRCNTHTNWQLWPWHSLILVCKSEVSIMDVMQSLKDFACLKIVS